MYMSICFIFFALLIYFTKKITLFWRVFFLSWFALSYLLMTSFGANLLVGLIAIDDSNKTCISNTAILLANGMTRHTLNDREYGAMSIESLNRVHSARRWLLLDSRNKILLTGSKANSEVPILNNYLMLMGVPSERLIIDNDSNTTFESSTNIDQWLSNKEPVFLITSQIHMRRALLSFEKSGYLVCPLISHNQHIRALGIRKFFPDSHAIIKSEKVIHELIGIAWYWSTDRI